MKKLLSLLLAISMILSMMSITVFATETEDTTPVPVAQIGDNTYETLAEAVYEANGNGGEIVLLADTTLSEKLDIDGTVILNLNGHTVTTAAVDGNYSIVVNHSLTITGDGTMNVEGVYGIGVKATGTLTVNGGTFNAAENSDYLIGNWGTTTINGGTFNGVYCCVNNFGGTTTINGGSYTTEATDASGAYESCDLFADAGMTIYGGSFSKEGVKDYVAEGATVTINGEEYTAGSTEEVPENSEQNPTYVTFTMNEDYTEGTATVTVPAGATYYFATTNNIGGMTMTANWYEVEVTYGNMWMGTDSTWSITNDTDADIEYLITISYPVGSQMNPAELSTEWANYSYHEAGSQGYFYTWTAPATGTLTIELYAEDANWNELGWFYVVNNMTTYIYGENQNSSSEPVVNPAIVTVAEGDEIQIIVNTYDPANEYNAPAGDMYVTASFECAEHGETTAVDNYDYATHNIVCAACGTVISENVAHEYDENDTCVCGAMKSGTESNPIDLTSDLLYENDFSATVTVAAGETVYYCAYRVGGMIMTINDGEGVTCTTNGMMYPYTWTITNDGEEAAEYVIVVSYPEGNQMNPEVIDNIIAFADTKELAENGSYYYIWTAEEDATVVLDVTDGANITVDKLTYSEDSEWPISEQFALAEAEYDENWNFTGWSVKDNLVFDVVAGQQLKIQVNGLLDYETYTTPAVTYTVSGAAMVTAEGECDTNAETVDVILSLADLELADANAIMVKLPSGDLELKSYEWLLEGDLTTDDTDKTAWAANDAIAVNGADGFLKLTFEAPEAVGEYDFQCEVTVKYEDEVLANVLVDGTVNVTPVVCQTDSGAAYNVRLIEPWALRVNVRFRDSDGNMIPVSELADYGAYAVRGSLLDSTSGVTLEQILADSDTIHFAKGTEADGGMFPTGDGRAAFHFFDGLFTYRLSEEVYWVAYYKDAAGNTYYTKVRNKSLNTLMNTMMTQVSANEAEVYKWMLDMEESILAYRNGRTGEAVVEEAKTVGTCGINFGVHSGSKYGFGRSYRISLIEPWGIMLNTRIHDTTDANTSSSDHIDYASADNYGVIVYHDKTSSLTGMDDYTDLLALDGAYVYSKDQGNLSIDGTKVCVAYNKDIYTYELNSKIYCVTFLEVDGKYYYSAMTTRNLYDLMGAKIAEAGGNKNAEIEVYEAMRGMYDSVTKYRAGL